MRINNGSRGRFWYRLIPVSVLAGLAVVFAWCFRDTLRDLGVNDHQFESEIADAANRHRIEPELVRAVIFQESRFDPAARGTKGEVGLMQVMPSGAAADYARVHRIPRYRETRLFNPQLNLEIGCWYLARALRRWENFARGTELALAHYNAGPARAEKWKPDTAAGEVIPRIAIPSTRRYVERIMQRYEQYRKENRNAEFRSSGSAGGPELVAEPAGPDRR